MKLPKHGGNAHENIKSYKLIQVKVRLTALQIGKSCGALHN